MQLLYGDSVGNRLGLIANRGLVLCPAASSDKAKELLNQISSVEIICVIQNRKLIITMARICLQASSKQSFTL